MFKWLVKFETHANEYLAQLKMMGREVIDDPSYYWSGLTRHHESHIAFQYTISGKGILKNKNGEFEVGPRTGFICDPTAPDVCYFYPPKSKEKWEFVWFVMVGKVAYDCAEHLISSYGNIISVDPRSPYIYDFLTYGDNHPQNVDLPLGDNSKMTYELLIGLDQEQRDHTVFNTINFVAMEAKKIISKGISENINVTQVAQKLKITREHLSRVFKKSTGFNISKYIIEQKVYSSTNLLLTTHLPIHQIASDLGFNSCSDFVQFFKKYTGNTPSEYRKKRKF
jgi:AraC-like DNA-binding protein